MTPEKRSIKNREKTALKRITESTGRRKKFAAFSAKAGSYAALCIAWNIKLEKRRELM